MDRIGVLTFHRALNFGAVLQSYALQTTLEKMGNECEIVDYRTPRIEVWFHNLTFKSKLKNILRYFMYHKYYMEIKRKEAKYKQFTMKYYKLSKYYKSSNDFSCDFDKIVVGSDQVWNLDMTQGDLSFFLPYNRGAEKLTYAASFGKNSLTDKNMDTIKHLLADFSALYVRESDGAKIVNDLVQREAKVVADPTLLIKKEDWISVCSPCKVKRKYILLYLVASPTYAMELARNIACEKNLDVIYIDPPRHSPDDFIRNKEAGPGEFLWLIKNAEYVVTTSYHGMILSMNLNTPFLYELAHIKGNTNSRLEEVVRLFGLEEYSIESANALDYCKLEYNWEAINSRIEAERQKSFALLKKLFRHK